MDTSDFKAHADYWNRQVELHPDDIEILDMRAIAVADYIIQLAVLDYFEDE